MPLKCDYHKSLEVLVMTKVYYSLTFEMAVNCSILKSKYICLPNFKTKLKMNSLRKQILCLWND